MKPASLSILTGILLGTSYIPFPAWAILFCYVPLWICWLEEFSLVRIFWTGWLAQFVFNLIGYNWVAYTVHEFGHLPWWAAVITLCLYCGFANIYLPLVGVAWAWLCRRLELRGSGKIWALPLMLALVERIFPMIFAWNLGYPWFWTRLPAFHLADMVGFIGLSSVTLLLNGLLLWAWWLRSQGSQSWRAIARSVPVLFVVLNFWGYFHGQRPARSDATLKFLLVQANIGNQEKLQAEQGWAFRDNVINKFTEATRRGLLASGPADFVVWPETAFPEVIDNPQLSYGYASKLKNFIISVRTKLITGAYSRKDGTNKITNSFMAISENGEWLARPYHKSVLLAFGEYLPGAEWFPSWRKLLPEVGDYGAGGGPTVMRIGTLNIGPQICYEGIFDWFTRDLANQGAHLIVNLTNDSWYGTWEQPFIHGYMTLARAVEVRRPLVRSTNTGISTVGLPSGEVMELSPLHQEWSHLYEVPYNTNPIPTLFMGIGYWIFPVALSGALIFLLGGATITMRRRRRKAGPGR